MREVDRLSACLAELERHNWTLDQYLAAHPDMPYELLCSLRAAGRVRSARPPRPSAAFRARSRSRLISVIQHDALLDTRRGRWWHALAAARRTFRPLLAPVAALLLLVSGGAGVWSASSSALPESPFYGAKLAFERAEVFAAFTPQQQLSIHLALAQTRLQEANAELRAGHRDAMDQLLQAFDRQIADVEGITRLPVNIVDVDLRTFASRQLALLESGRQDLVGPVLARTDSRDVAPNSLTQPATVSIATAPAPSSGPSVVSADPTKLQPGADAVLVADASSDRLDQALVANRGGGFRLSTGASLPGVSIAPPSVVTATRSGGPARGTTSARPAQVATPIAAAPTAVPVAPIGAVPAPVVPTPIPVIGGPPSGGGNQNPPTQSPPVPVPLPTPIGNPSIPIPIIVHNPTRLPSPALTGHKPVVSPVQAPPAR